MEDDFPFSFGGSGSDQDGSGDDGLFCAPKSKKKAAAKTKALLSQEPYHAQIDEDGWFHNTGKTTYELMTQSKTGATKVKMRADHYYMLHRYQEAFDIAQEFCELVRTSGLSVSQGDGGLRRPDEGATPAATTDAGVLKVSDPKEMQEMALRCALKLNMFDVAASLADELVMHDTGIVFLKAKAYVAVGRFNDAALGLVQYQKSRTGNYSIWRTLGECLQQSILPTSGSRLHISVPASTPPSTSTAALPLLDTLSISSLTPQQQQPPPKPTVVYILALMCILRARYLMRISTWAQVPYAQARYDNEMSILDEQRVELERQCGLYLEMTSAEQTDGAAAAATLEEKVTQRRLEEYELKVVAPARNLVDCMKESGVAAIGPDQGVFSLEVIEFVVRTWDQQVVALNDIVLGMTADDDDLAGKVSVRNK
ncbi:hypothetical protein BGZ95_005229 [Linnemannia exigua]|uniref:Uncharacterized protein n=1 Tax=Linnemannia exigua TaxID=604196 RepID=A0AAD4DHB5_9FUNG|nr:hypothetical protein BGZ95_005229 [Linnemannia exigua]